MNNQGNRYLEFHQRIDHYLLEFHIPLIGAYEQHFPESHTDAKGLEIKNDKIDLQKMTAMLSFTPQTTFSKQVLK